MEWKYKNTTNMSDKDKKEFFLNPHEWFKKELMEALKHDPLLLNCYRVFQELMGVKEPFETLEFLTMALYQALLSNSVNFNQLIEAVNRNPNPPKRILLSGN